MVEMVTHAPRRTLLWVGVVAAIGVGVAVWRVETNASASSTALVPSFKVTRANLVVSVGGVGRIVERNTANQITIPGGSSSSSASGSGTGSTGTNTAPGDAIFARGAGHVARILVVPGQRVKAGQPIAVLDDGGAAAAAVAAAQNDLETAQVELQQRLTQDPLRGFPATPAEIAAAQFAVKSAKQKLAHLHAGPRPGDVATARADIAKSKADLATLTGTAAARQRALALAREAVRVARAKLARLFVPANPADISAAEADVKKAVADKAALLKQPPGPTQEAIDAADQAVALAQHRVARLYSPPDPVAMTQATQDLKQAQADLAALQSQKPPASAQALDAGQAAVDTANAKLQKLQAPPDPLDVQAAQADVAKALADRAALSQLPPGPTPEAIEAADQAIDAAKRKLNRLHAKPNPADVSQARLDLANAEASVRTLQAGPTPEALASARHAIAASRARLAQLYAPPFRSDVTAAKLDVKKAEADLAALLARRAPSSTFDVELANLKIRAAQEKLAVARLAERQLTVRATSGGTVTSLLTRLGAPVDGTTPIATVSDLADLAVMVNLSEFDAAQVKRGQTARVSVDALGGKIFLGKVVFAALSGSDSGGGVVTFPVEVGLKRLTGVKPGMNASVRIIVAARRHVLEVPLEAVTKDDEDRSVVTVLDAAGQTSLKPVKLGLANNKNVEIISGIHAGQRLVIAPAEEGD